MKIKILYATDCDNNDERTSLLAVKICSSLDNRFVEKKVSELLLGRYGMTRRQIEVLVENICEGNETEFGAYSFHWETIEMQPVA